LCPSDFLQLSKGLPRREGNDLIVALTLTCAIFLPQPDPSQKSSAPGRLAASAWVPHLYGGCPDLPDTTLDTDICLIAITPMLSLHLLERQLDKYARRMRDRV